MPSPKILATAFSVAFLHLSCGGGGGGGGGPAASGGEGLLLAKDSPSDDLLAFRAKVTGLRLRDGAGGLTGDLLAADRTLEWRSLEEKHAILGVATLPTRTFVEAEIEFDPLSLEAIDLSGLPVAVSASSGSAAFPLVPPLVVGAGATAPLSLDLNLPLTLSNDPTNPGALLFLPSVSGSGSLPSGAVVDEFRGAVLSKDPATLSFVADLVSNDDPSVVFGRIRVFVDDGDLLLDDDGNAFPNALSFLAALFPGVLVEVHGTIGAGGSIAATAVEIEDDAATLVRLEGRVLSIAAATPSSGVFTLLLREIEKGAPIAAPILGGLPNPNLVPVAWGPATKFVLEGPGGGLVPPSALFVGAEVKAKFAAFVPPAPFLASRIEIEDEGQQFEGTVLSVAGLPGSVTVLLSGNDPAVVAGLVAGPVTVALSGASLFLHLDGNPPLVPGDLLPGQKVRIKGTLSGPPSAATIGANSVRVRAGRLRGTVLSVLPLTSEFVTTVESLDDPFGGTILDPALVAFVPGAVVTGDASSIPGFYALFGSLGFGQSLEVEVFGIGNPDGSVRTFRVKAEVDD